MTELLTVKQVAELLQLHEMTIRRYIQAGKLEAVRVGRRIRVPRVAVEKMMVPQVEEDAPVALREPAVAYHVGSAASVRFVAPTVEQIAADLVGLDDDGRMQVSAVIAELRADQEKRKWEETKNRILREAHQMALEMADWPREKVIEQFKEVTEEIRRQAIGKGAF